MRTREGPIVMGNIPEKDVSYHRRTDRKTPLPDLEDSIRNVFLNFVSTC